MWEFIILHVDNKIIHTFICTQVHIIIYIYYAVTSPKKFLMGGAVNIIRIIIHYLLYINIGI